MPFGAQPAEVLARVLAELGSDWSFVAPEGISLEETKGKVEFPGLPSADGPLFAAIFKARAQGLKAFAQRFRFVFPQPCSMPCRSGGGQVLQEIKPARHVLDKFWRDKPSAAPNKRAWDWGAAPLAYWRSCITPLSSGHCFEVRSENALAPALSPVANANCR